VRIDDASRETERWKNEALTHAKKLKDAEQRLQQLEQRHTEDKARIRVLAEQMCATPASINAEPKKDDKDTAQNVGKTNTGTGSRTHRSASRGRPAQTEVSTKSRWWSLSLWDLLGVGRSRDAAGYAPPASKVGPIVHKGRRSGKEVRQLPQRSWGPLSEGEDEEDGAGHAKPGQREVLVALVVLIVALAVAKTCL